MHDVSFFVFPSYSSKDIYSKYYGLNEDICRVIYHGTTLIKSEGLIPGRGDKNFALVLWINNVKHKGRQLFKRLLTRCINIREVFHFGDGELTGKNLIKLGRYKRNNIVELIRSKKLI
jgi:hypothetical protein